MLGREPASLGEFHQDNVEGPDHEDAQPRHRQGAGSEQGEKELGEDGETDHSAIIGGQGAGSMKGVEARKFW